MKTFYFYLDNTKIIDGQEFYTVIRSSAKYCCVADEKAKQWARMQGLKLAGGMFYAGSKPHDFKINYTVLELPKGFRAKAHEEDFIDRLIAYESGEMNTTKTKAFFKELKQTGIGHKLQGHYSSRM